MRAILIGGPCDHIGWLSVIVVSVCPLIPSLSAYCLTWVSLTLDVGSLFTAVPAKHSCCALPLMRGSSSWLWWRGLTECGPLEKGMANLHYFCLENLMNSMKRQKDRTLKDELVRLVGAQYATGDQWRNNSRKNEGMEPKQR